MTFKDVLRNRGGGDEGVPFHEHDASEVSGDATFLDVEANRILAGTISGQTIVVAGTGSIQSDDFVDGVSGWRILGTGSAQFDDVDIRGSLNVGEDVLVALGEAGEAALRFRTFPTNALEIVAGGSSDLVLKVDDGGFTVSVDGGFSVSADGAQQFGVDTPSGFILSVGQFQINGEPLIISAGNPGVEVARFSGVDGHNLQGLPWTTWSPTLTNLTLGNGTQMARYRRIGQTVEFAYRFTLGSTSAVGTDPRISVPVAPASSYQVTVDLVATGLLRDSSSGSFAGGACFGSSLTQFQPLRTSVSGSLIQYGSLTATAPFTWETGDSFFLSGSYEAAA